MSHCKLYLFGPPRLEYDGESVEIGLRKALALLVYLAATGQPHSRDALATLLWPESSQREGRASLRRTLYRLNNAVDAELFVVAAESVAINPEIDLWLDVEAFRQAVQQFLPAEHPVAEMSEENITGLCAASELYTDDFLAGFTLPDSPVFDEWQFFQREELCQTLDHVLEQLVYVYSARCQYEQALPHARRRLALDSLNESVHRQLMQLYALAGQQAAALRQYAECERILAEELDVAPEPETTELAEAIRTKRFPGRTVPSRRSAVVVPVTLPEPVPAPAAPHYAVPVGSPRDTGLAPLPSPAGIGFSQQTTTATPRHNLPAEPTPLIGRETESAQLYNMLTNPLCRLITVVGLGGIGKTHLVLDVAHRLMAQEPDSFAHGTTYVSLVEQEDPVDAVDSVIFALAEALDLHLSGSAEPKEEVLAHLHGREMLLILDNAEHLLLSTRALDSPDALAGAANDPVTDLVAAILAAGEHVKLLVTSREPLHLRMEWRLDLKGLTYPPTEVNTAEVNTEVEPTPAALQNYSAVQLFLQTAQQTQPGFVLCDEDVPHVYRLCQLVGGLPLAIKLAAAWIRLMPCARIVTEVDSSLDILSTPLRDIPPRQRSLRVVFDYTWRLLANAEKAVFRALSVCRGGFSEEAAARVANATPTLLAGLLDRGLLEIRVTPLGVRYVLHAVTRQFAAEKLDEDPDERHAIQRRHSTYYLEFLQTLEGALTGKDLQSALNAVQDQIDNVRIAWNWALAEPDMDLFMRGISALYRFYWSRSRAQEGKEIFTRAIKQVQVDAALRDHPQLESVQRNLLQKRGLFHYFLGEYEAAKEDLHRAATLARRLNDPQEVAGALAILGAIARWQGQRAVALQHLQQSLQIFREIGYVDGQADVMHELAQLHAYFGEYAEAEQMGRESLALSRRLERPDWIAWALDVRGWTAFRRGDYAAARACYEESRQLFEQLDHRLGIALAVGGLGLVAWAGDNDVETATSLLQRSLAICHDVGHRFHVASRLTMLAQVANEAGDFVGAERYAAEGLAIATELNSVMFVAYCRCCLAEVAYRRADFSTAGQHLREAVCVTYESGVLPQTLIALFHVARLWVKQSHRDDADAPEATSSKMHALALLSLVERHPMSWRLFQEKASALRQTLSAELPAAAVAQVDAHPLTLDEAVGTVLAEAADLVEG